ncbi:hypothetical protein ACHAQA_003999 [Verticillium albo-atrum]
MGAHPSPGYGYAGNGMESQQSTYMSDPRLGQHGSPPPGMPYSPNQNLPVSQAPVELPTPGNPTSTPPSYPTKPF